MTSILNEKWLRLNCFSLQRTVCSPTGPDPESIVGDEETGSPGRQFPSGLQVTGEPGHLSAKQDPIGELPAAFVTQNVLQLPRQRFVILRVHSLTLLKISNEEDAVLIPQKIRGEKFSSGFLQSEFFWMG
jgi:hypothetical protein